MEKERGSSHPRGHAVALAEMLHNRKKKKKVKDGSYVGNISDMVHKRLALATWCQHTDTENLLLEDIVQSNISIDKISQFLICPPEFCYVFDRVEASFRWFEIEKEATSADGMLEELNDELELSP
eukprot:14723020-Ditylum_brightwellii.AAC.2